MNKEGFLNAINTLKLYRRAELIDENGRRLVKALYVDPLPDDHVLKTILWPNSTFLIGRKGTGKSTIFQRAQEALDEDKNVTWAYIDIKTLFESSTSEIVGRIPPGLDSALPREAVQKLYVFKNFIIDLVKEIKKQIASRVNSTVWGRIREAFVGSTAELFEKLDEFIQEIEQDEYWNITGSILSTEQTNFSAKDSSKLNTEASAKLGKDPSFDVKAIAELVAEIERKKSENYSQVFIRVFNIRELIFRLRQILSTLNLKRIYIFIDDFSELPRKDMEEVVDSILSPFNNWSDEFIKLKVAVYPGRVYLGNIDRSKGCNSKLRA